MALRQAFAFNREILIAPRRAHFMLNVSKHIMGVSHVMPKDGPSIAEHLKVFLRHA